MTADQTLDTVPTQLPSAADALIVSAEFPQFSPEALFAHWTEPELLSRWWPPVAEIQQYAGGQYHFSWPANDWHLRGTFTRFEPPHGLGFTWKWDHDPDAPGTEVQIAIAEHESGGSQLTLMHGRYDGSDAGRKMRQSHLEGWMYFVGRLQELEASS